MNSPKLSVKDLRKGIINSDRIVLSRAITLIESNKPADQELARELLNEILPLTGNSLRIGITGVPGVGKSTFIEAFGKTIISQNLKVAILTIDPSSQISKGSILGDKTRMSELSKDTHAFIRPSSSGQTLGGIGNKTRESILLCEAAGYDVVIVETIGVGQSEVTVKSVVDFFLLLILAGAGDELQGIKKGIMEMADALVITKADHDNKKKALEAQSEYQHALHLLRKDEQSGWSPKVLLSSAVTNEGILDIWKLIKEFETKTKNNGSFERSRQKQLVTWMHESFNQLIDQEIKNNPYLKEKMQHLESLVVKKEIASPQASRILFEEFLKNKR